MSQAACLSTGVLDTSIMKMNAVYLYLCWLKSMWATSRLLSCARHLLAVQFRGFLRNMPQQY